MGSEACERTTPADMESRSLAGLLRGSSRAPTRPYAFIEFQDILYACVGDGRESARTRLTLRDRVPGHVQRGARVRARAHDLHVE